MEGMLISLNSIHKAKKRQVKNNKSKEKKGKGNKEGNEKHKHILKDNKKRRIIQNKSVHIKKEK